MNNVFISRAGASLVVLLLSAPPVLAQITRVVDHDGHASPASCDDVTPALTTPAAAIVAAGAGDTILVCPGTYAGIISFSGKAITLRSVNGPADTVLDGNAAGSVVTFENGETASSVLEGFTIRNGLAPVSGGGIRIRSASPIVRGNVVVGNRACESMGISIEFGSPLIEENTIAYNIQTGCSGGTLGGGIGIMGTSTAVIRHNNIHHNARVFCGGGICLFAAGAPTIEQNVMWANDAEQGGGIGLFNDSHAIIRGNLIARNAAGKGGGIFWLVPAAGGPLLVNNTIADNNSLNGSGIWAEGVATGARLFNNSIAAAAGQTAVYCGETFPDIPVLNFNNVFSATGLRYAGVCTDQTGLDGNISADPQFAGPRDYHLSATSPNIDAGTNSAPGLPATDYDEHARVLDGNADGDSIVDIGADEFPLLAPPSVPGAFGKSAPGNPSPVTAAGVSLRWSASSGATGYEYCFDTIDDGACGTIWLPAWNHTDVTLPDLTGSTTYFWQVRANNSSGTTYADGEGSSSWRFTTLATRIIALSGSLQFPSVRLGTTATRTFTIRNEGTGPLTVSGISYPSGFSGAWSGSIPAGGSHDVTVTFAPTAPIAYDGTVTVSADKTSGMTTVPATGRGVCGVALLPRTVDVSPRGSTLSVSVDAPVGCSWTVESRVPWVIVQNPIAGSGTGSFSVVIEQNSTMASRFGTVAVADGILPIRQGAAAAQRFWWQHQTEGYVSAWNMRGTNLVSALGVAHVANTDWKIVGAGDFNGDTQPDLVWYNQRARLLTVWLMSGTSFLASGLLSPNTVSDSQWAVRAIADMNGDTKPDIVWQHAADGWLAVWIMDGLVLKQGVALGPGRVDPAWRIAAAGDLDNDGMTDLVWQNDLTGLVTTWLMHGTAFSSVGFSASADPAWKIKAVVDLDGDRNADIVWHQQTTGALIVWYMNGRTFLSGAALTPAVVSPAWQLVAVR